MEAGGELPRDFGRSEGKKKRRNNGRAPQEKCKCRIRSNKRYETTSREFIVHWACRAQCPPAVCGSCAILAGLAATSQVGFEMASSASNCRRVRPLTAEDLSIDMPVWLYGHGLFPRDLRNAKLADCRLGLSHINNNHCHINGQRNRGQSPPTAI